MEEEVSSSAIPLPSPFHGRSFFCHHTKKEPLREPQDRRRKSLRPPIPTTARPVVLEKCLPRIQAIFPSLPVGKTGLPLHPPWRTVPSHEHCTVSIYEYMDTVHEIVRAPFYRKGEWCGGRRAGDEGP